LGTGVSESIYQARRGWRFAEADHRLLWVSTTRRPPQDANNPAEVAKTDDDSSEATPL